MTEHEENDTKQSNSSSFWSLIILIVLGTWAYNAWLKPDKWIGIYELPTANAVQSTYEFGSREECALWKDAKLSNPQGAYSIECGKNCDPPDSEMGLYVCEETF